MNYYINSEFEIQKMWGDIYLAGKDMKSALDQTDICLNIIAKQNEMPSNRFHESAYKGYVILAKEFHSKENHEGARYSLEYAIIHQNNLTGLEDPRTGLVRELLDYIENRRKDYPMR
jgi:hypothetical protein